MVTDSIPQLKALSLAKKRRLISELIDDVFGQPVADRALAEALATRVEHYRKNPSSGRSWNAVKARLRARK